MAGLSLSTGFRVQPAAPPSASGTTITQQAFGPLSGADITGAKTAALGTVGAGLIATGLLVFLWWSLPR